MSQYMSHSNKFCYKVAYVIMVCLMYIAFIRRLKTRFNDGSNVVAIFKLHRFHKSNTVEDSKIIEKSESHEIV